MNCVSDVSRYTQNLVKCGFGLGRTDFVVGSHIFFVVTCIAMELSGFQ